MAEVLDIASFLQRHKEWTLFDVRTPAEFEQGHIPGAINLPLFSNDERAEIGTLYKQQGRTAAMLRSLELIGPKMRDMVEEAQSQMVDNRALIHCWRGGMRSEAVGWLLGFFGCQVATLKGGYKAFRHHALASFEVRRVVYMLGGMSGARKTEVLHKLADRGEQILDLEGIAHHKGSVFGHLGEYPQPSQEHFENVLALRWLSLNADRPVWIEDESRRIGRLLVPHGIWDHMQHADVYLLDIPFDIRAHHLLRIYGAHSVSTLIQATDCIGKRLGGLRTRQAQEALKRGDLEQACHILLTYYDKAYQHSLAGRRVVKHSVPVSRPYRLADLTEAVLKTASASQSKAIALS